MATFPGDVGAQLPRRVSVRETLQRLQHHYRGDDIRRHRRPPAARRKEISEQLVGEQLLPMVCQEVSDGALLHQVPAEGCGIEEFAVGVARTLHSAIDSHPQTPV